jgi:hypothetical protein
MVARATLESRARSLHFHPPPETRSGSRRMMGPSGSIGPALAFSRLQRLRPAPRARLAWPSQVLASKSSIYRRRFPGRRPWGPPHRAIYASATLGKIHACCGTTRSALWGLSSSYWPECCGSSASNSIVQEDLLSDGQEFVQLSRSSALIQMIARLDELLIDS